MNAATYLKKPSSNFKIQLSSDAKKTILVLGIGLILSVFSIAQGQARDYSDKITVLGNPYAEKYKTDESIYARNVWDLQLYDGKIYIGAGNSSNAGPAPNAGRVPLFYLDLKTETFTKEYVVAEEQVDRFKLFNNTLYIPGHDATQRWELGNFYMYESNRWRKIRTIPVALHVYDMIVHRDRLFAGGSIKKYASVFISEDNGHSWTTQALDRGRVYTTFTLKEDIFAVMSFSRKKTKWGGLFRWSESTGKFEKLEEYRAKQFFPDTTFRFRTMKITRQLSIKNNLYYIGVYHHNDHQGIPFGFYRLDSDSGKLTATRIILPTYELPRDLIHRKDEVYLLTTRKNQNRFISSVFKIDLLNGDRTEKVLSFSYPAFARSFEKHQNNFYFGIGSEIKNPKDWEVEELSPHTGEIIKIKAW